MDKQGNILIVRLNQLAAILLVVTSCQKKDDSVHTRILNSPPMGDPFVYLIVQSKTTGVNLFDTAQESSWSVDQVKSEQLLISGEIKEPLSKPKIVSTGKGEMLQLVTSKIYSNQYGVSKIKVNWPDKSSDIFRFYFADAGRDNRIIKVFMNQEQILPVANDSRTYAIIEK